MLRAPQRRCPNNCPHGKRQTIGRRHRNWFSSFHYIRTQSAVPHRSKDHYDYIPFWSGLVENESKKSKIPRSTIQCEHLLVIHSMYIPVSVRCVRVRVSTIDTTHFEMLKLNVEAHFPFSNSNCNSFLSLRHRY